MSHYPETPQMRPLEVIISVTLAAFIVIIAGTTLLLLSPAILLYYLIKIFQK